MAIKRIRLLLIYHGAALEPSRKIFEALAAHREIQLKVLAPRKGFNPLRKSVFEIRKPYYGKYELVTGRVYKAMQDFSRPYLTGLLHEVLFFRPDVIHVFNEAYSTVSFQAHFYKSIFRPSAKCYCLGVDNIIRRETRNYRERFIRNFIHRHCNGVACWSASARGAIYNAGFPIEKLKITYWGIPLSQFTPSRNEVLRDRLGVSDKFVVGYCGRFEKEKGLLTLLLAMRRLPKNCHVLCVGNGSWKNKFFEKVHELGLTNRVHWIDRVPDGNVQDYMNAMDVLVLPSETTSNWKEQFGRVLPEAMSCGLPIIGSDSGAIPEIVGNAGLIFPERNFSKLAHSIKKLASCPDLHNELGELGIKRANEFFSCEAFSSRLINLYFNGES